MKQNPQTFQKIIYFYNALFAVFPQSFFKFSAHKVIVGRIQGCDHIFSRADLREEGLVYVIISRR